jgi:hypothetical protein
MAGQLRAPLIFVESIPEGTVSIRAPLVFVEPLTEHFRQLRADLVYLEPLTEHFRTLRTAFLFVESLHPVPPEGHVSTELFPGSLGSSIALPGLAYTVHKRPRFSTLVHQAQSGVSVRNAQMQYPIWEFELSYEFLRDDVTNEYRTLLGFFLKRQGGFDTFLLKDKDDYLSRRQPGFSRRLGAATATPCLRPASRQAVRHRQCFTITPTQGAVVRLTDAAGGRLDRRLERRQPLHLRGAPGGDHRPRVALVDGRRGRRAGDRDRLRRWTRCSRTGSRGPRRCCWAGSTARRSAATGRSPGLGPPWVGVTRMFLGRRSRAGFVGRTIAKLKVKLGPVAAQPPDAQGSLRLKCRNVFGDARCGIDLNSLAVLGTVGAARRARPFRGRARLRLFVRQDPHHQWRQRHARAHRS